MRAIVARTHAFTARKDGCGAHPKSSPKFTQLGCSTVSRPLRAAQAPKVYKVPRALTARHVHGSSDDAVPDASSEARTAKVGDVVSIHWACLDENGDTIETSRTSGEPTTFEVGAGDIVGNELFEAFDEAVRGLSVGEKIGIKADGPAWTEELMFNVPMDHPEIERMNGRYKNQGGCHEGLLAELSNGGMAVVVKVDDEAGMVVLDANSMMAGKSLVFELELLDIADE